ncbi:glycosyltransferase [Candidatus Microgenomates bacterium]|nr:glycosyltransferase [Candidatus Microgenomates bacterium]
MGSKSGKNSSVSVIIPNLNGETLLSKNLPSVLKAYKNSVNKIVEVIIVDDGSTDSSIEVIKKNFPEVKLIKHSSNRGFSAAINTGVRHSKGNLLCLLNNDVSISIDILKNPLKLFAGNNNLFGVSFHEKGSGWATGNFENGYIVHGRGKEDIKVHKTFFVNAGGALYSKNLWMKVGGMDEKVLSPFYWEDVDVSYKALKRGYELMWDPFAFVSPNLSATIKKMNQGKVKKIQERNHLLFVWKNLTSNNLMKKHMVSLVKRTISHPGYLRIILMALMRYKDMRRSRAKEIKESTVSDETIFSKYS